MTYLKFLKEVMGITEPNITEVVKYLNPVMSAMEICTDHGTRNWTNRRNARKLFDARRPCAKNG
jgi:hypothetical protein